MVKHIWSFFSSYPYPPWGHLTSVLVPSVLLPQSKLLVFHAWGINCHLGTYLHSCPGISFPLVLNSVYLDSYVIF